MAQTLPILLTLTFGAGFNNCTAMQEARTESGYSYSNNFCWCPTYDFVQSHGMMSATSRLGLVLRNCYASGEDVPDNDRAEAVLRRSVRSIFDRYRILAKGYLLAPNATKSGGHQPWGPEKWVSQSSASN